MPASGGNTVGQASTHETVIVAALGVPTQGSSPQTVLFTVIEQLSVPLQPLAPAAPDITSVILLRSREEHALLNRFSLCLLCRAEQF